MTPAGYQTIATAASEPVVLSLPAGCARTQIGCRNKRSSGCAGYPAGDRCCAAPHAVWEMLVPQGGARHLPPPSRVLSDTWELIVDPFFDRGGIDKGLFWHLSRQPAARRA